MQKHKFLTTAMVGERLGFTADYIRRLIACGKIKAEKLGHDWLIPEKSILHIKRSRRPKDS